MGGARDQAALERYFLANRDQYAHPSQAAPEVIVLMQDIFSLSEDAEAEVRCWSAGTSIGQQYS
jgi:hypothetical protein